MSTHLSRTTGVVSTQVDLTDAATFMAESLAPNTRRAYAASMRAFRTWCAVRGLDPLPAAPETVVAFLADEAKVGRRVATIAQRVAAIRWAHEARELDAPTRSKGVAATLAGIRRKLGTAPHRKAPATVEVLSAMAAHADKKTLKGKRDR